MRRRMMANSTSLSADWIAAWQARRKSSGRYASASVRGESASAPWRISTTHSRQRPDRPQDWGTATETASA